MNKDDLIPKVLEMLEQVHKRLDVVDVLAVRVGKLEDAFVVLTNEVCVLKTEVSDLRTEVGGLRTEVSDLRTEVGDLRTEVGDLRREVSDLKDEVFDLKITVQMTFDHIEDIYERQQEHEEKLSWLQSNVLTKNSLDQFRIISS